MNSPARQRVKQLRGAGQKVGVWRRQAMARIDAALEEAKRLGLEGLAIAKFVRSAYPFGQRKYFPYKVWLRCCRDTIGVEYEGKPPRRLKYKRLALKGQRSFMEIFAQQEQGGD